MKEKLRTVKHTKVHFMSKSLGTLDYDVFMSVGEQSMKYTIV